MSGGEKRRKGPKRAGRPKPPPCDIGNHLFVIKGKRAVCRICGAVARRVSID